MVRRNQSGIVAVFDVDKTLLDSGRKLQIDVVEAMGRLGTHIAPEEVSGDWYGLAEAHGLDRDEFDRELDKRKSWERALRDGDAPLFDDVIPCLDRLQDEGVRLAVLTRSTPEYTEAKLEHYRLRRYFGDNVAVTPFKSPGGKGQEAIELVRGLGFDTIERAYFIGDNPEDVIVDAAVHDALGIQTHGVHLDRNGEGFSDEIATVKHPYERSHVKTLAEVPDIILGGTD
ncbi:MAG: HAD family hydrolase [Nanoarchaeota archaeon]